MGTTPVGGVRPDYNRLLMNSEDIGHFERFLGKELGTEVVTWSADAGQPSKQQQVRVYRAMMFSRSDIHDHLRPNASIPMSKLVTDLVAKGFSFDVTPGDSVRMKSNAVILQKVLASDHVVDPIRLEYNTNGTVIARNVADFPVEIRASKSHSLFLEPGQISQPIPRSQFDGKPVAFNQFGGNPAYAGTSPLPSQVKRMALAYHAHSALEARNKKEDREAALPRQGVPGMLPPGGSGVHNGPPVPPTRESANDTQKDQAPQLPIIPSEVSVGNLTLTVKKQGGVPYLELNGLSRIPGIQIVSRQRSGVPQLKQLEGNTVAATAIRQGGKILIPLATFDNLGGVVSLAFNDGRQQISINGKAIDGLNQMVSAATR